MVLKNQETKAIMSSLARIGMKIFDSVFNKYVFFNRPFSSIIAIKTLFRPLLEMKTIFHIPETLLEERHINVDI